MRFRSSHKLLLVAVLAASQWLAIAHDYQHPATNGDQLCQVCVHGQTFQAGPLSATTLACHDLTSEAPQNGRLESVPTHRRTHSTIRAPPVSLV